MPGRQHGQGGRSGVRRMPEGRNRRHAPDAGVPHRRHPFRRDAADRDDGATQLAKLGKSSKPTGGTAGMYPAGMVGVVYAGMPGV